MKHKIRSRNSRFLKSKLALAMQMLIFGEALAAPAGGDIVGGSGSVTQRGAETTIVQDSERLAIDWQSFDVGENERVEFIQPGESAVALNRILGDKGSEILGRIDANGHVILVNPNGVVFGQGAVVNAGGLIASGLQINPDDFMNGDLIFKHIGGTDGTVINSGLINAASGGNVALIGTQVENRGLISANLASVTLASGAEAVLTFDDSGLLGVQVDKAVLQSELGDKAAVTNEGDIRADGGRILLSASTTRDVFSQAVNWGEQKQARSVIYSDDGSFTLGAGGDVVNSGTITTSGSVAGDIVVLGENITHSGSIRADSAEGRAGHVELHANTTTKIIGDSETTANAEQGGDIKLLGQNIGLFDRAKVEAIGTNGGGLVLVGGDKEGQNQQVRNADFVYASEDSSLDVSASRVGNGGTAIIFAEDTARVYGNISARGGSQQGNGGFVETSGKRGFSIKSAPDVSAMDGKWGHWLIDPYNITVTSQGESLEDGEFESQSDSMVSVDAITTVLSGGGNVTLTTGGSEGNITISAPIEVSLAENATLNLLAHNDIIINENIQATGSNELNLNLHANRSNKETDGGNVKFGTISGDAVTIQTNGGDFKIFKIDGNSAVSPGAYDIDLTNLTIDVSGGNFVAHAENKLTRHQDFKIQNGNLTLGAAEWEFAAPGSRPALISTGNGNISFFTGGELRLPSIKSAGDITLNVRDAKESGLFEVHNRTSIGDGRREFSLGGTLTLNLGSQGSAEIHNIKSAEDSDNDIKVVVSDRMDQSSQNVDLQTPLGVILGEVAVDGDFFLEAGGAITQVGVAGLNIRGQSKFFSNQLTLDNLKNSFAKTVSIGGSANTVVLKAEGDLTLADAKQQKGFGSLDVEAAGGHIQQEGALKVTTITLSADQITLDHEGNNFSSIKIARPGNEKIVTSAKIVDSEGLELTAVNVLGKLELSGMSTLTQSGAVTVGELDLDIDGVALSGNENRIGALSGSVREGNIKVNGPLKIADFHFGGMWRREGYDLTIEQTQVEGVSTEGSNVSVDSANVEVGNIELSGNANLTISNFKEFLLTGSVRGASAGTKTLTVNGIEGEESSYEIATDAHWTGVSLKINGLGKGTLIGPASESTWSIKTDGIHQLSTDERQLSFEGIHKIKGGSDTDTLDYSEFSSENIPLWNLPEISTIDNIEVVKGNNSQTLVAPANTTNTWTIGNGRNAIETIEKTTVEQANGDVVELVEVLIKRYVEFQGFTDFKGGEGVDNFIVELHGQGSNGPAPNYQLNGGGSADSLVVKSEDGWSGTYGAGQNGDPEFIFSFSEQDRIKVSYDEIEGVSLTNQLDQMEVKGTSGTHDQIQLSAGWWQLNGFEKVMYDGGLQSLVVEVGSSDAISLVREIENATPPNTNDDLVEPIEFIRIPDSLTLKGGALSFDAGVQLETKNLNLRELHSGIGTKESPLIISIETLELANNAGDIYIRELNGMSLNGLSGRGLIDLEVAAGNLSQVGAISIKDDTMHRGSLQLSAIAGDILLENDANEIDVPINLNAAGWAAVHTQGDLVLSEAKAGNLILRANDGISSEGGVFVAERAELVSGANIILEHKDNDFGTVIINQVRDDAKVNVNLVDRNQLILGGINISGELKISANPIYFNGLIRAETLSTRDAGKVFVGQPALIKYDVNFGGAQVTGIELVHSEHGQIHGARTFGSADQMIEVETLAEIDPAIFTNVKNYFYQDVSVLLPSDQRYEESSEEDALSWMDPLIFTNVKNYFYQDVSVLLPSDQRYEESSEEDALSWMDPLIFFDGEGHAYRGSRVGRY